MPPQLFTNYSTAGLQKLWHHTHWFYRIMRCHSFCIPAVVLNHCAVLVDHNNAWFSCKYRTVRAGLNFAHKKCEVWIFFAQTGCLTINTLLRGPNIIIWSHVLCQVHHPFHHPMCHMSHVPCHMSHSHVTCHVHVSNTFLIKKNVDQAVKLVSGGSVISRAIVSSFSVCANNS